jgi:hypothetical protein
MTHGSLRIYPAAALRTAWCLAILVSIVLPGARAASAARATSTSSGAGEVTPSQPAACRGVATLDPASRTIRRSCATRTADVPPSGEAPAVADPACSSRTGTDGTVYRDSTTSVRRVDACGTVAGEGRTPTHDTQLASALTIDRMTTTIGYSDTHTLGQPILLFGSANVYQLNDGSSWNSGAGSYTLKRSYLDRVEVAGTTVRYVLRTPADGLMYQQTDYDSGDHSAQGSLGASGALVIEATIGSTTATMRGSVTVASNDETYYGDRFNFYSAIPGATVPFELTYTIQGATWQPGTFDTTFYYGCTGWVDFAHPTSVPAIASLELRGSAQVPSNASAHYTAIVAYANGVERDVARLATWTAEPAAIVHISAGTLTTGTFAHDRQEVTIRATYATGGRTVDSVKTVLGRLSSIVSDPDSWPTYQANERHTGYVPRRFDTETFSLRWSKAVAPGFTLNPVTSVDGRVFVTPVGYFSPGMSLFALDARDGATLWTKDFGSVFSVNPPAWGYGNVYVQTGNHTPGTWIHAFDAESGALVFSSPLEAQWERYFAPTVFDGGVYVNGGYYGGMYALDAFSGERRWFAGLPQYDGWTPAVTTTSAYAYVGEYQPGLYVFDRQTGQPSAVIADPDFDWNGWTMNLAPVVLEGGDAIAIHDGRLIRFDLAGRRIAWQLASSYSGQPSYAGGVIYAIDGARVVAIAADTGNEQWSWTVPGGMPRGSLIVTDSHLFVSTPSDVYAVDLLSRSSDWSYPAGGSLALGDDNLYVAQQDGTLVAIAAAPQTPSLPDSIEIRGPADAIEFTSVQYRAYVHYVDGRVRERTNVTTWSAQPAHTVSVSDGGVMTVPEMLVLSAMVDLGASYSEAGVTVQATRPVQLHASVTLPEFIERNRARAAEIQNEVIANLAEAISREQAILDALNAPGHGLLSGPGTPYFAAIMRARDADELAAATAQRALADLELVGGSPPPAP